MELLGQRVRAYFILIDLANLLYKKVVLVYISTSYVGVHVLSHLAQPGYYLDNIFKISAFKEIGDSYWKQLIFVQWTEEILITLKVVSSTFMCMTNDDKTKKKKSTAKGNENLLDGFAFSFLPCTSHLGSRWRGSLASWVTGARKGAPAAAPPTMGPGSAVSLVSRLSRGCGR